MEKVANLNKIINASLELDAEWLSGFLAEADGLIPSNLSVHDPDKGGILWVANRKQEDRETHMATVDRKNLTNEVGLSRAMFNQRAIPIEGQEHKCISFEAPLLRRDRGSGSRKVACDVVCLSAEPPWRLTAVEVKIKGGPATNLNYAILEARAYARYLQYALDHYPDELRQEINTCLGRYHPGEEAKVSPDDLTVGYTVAGPQQYLAEQFDNPKALSIIDRLSQEPDSCFDGFWELSSANGGDDLVVRSDNDQKADVFTPVLKKGVSINKIQFPQAD